MNPLTTPTRISGIHRYQTILQIGKPLLLIIPPLSLLLFFSISLTPTNPFSTLSPLASHFFNKTTLITLPSTSQQQIFHQTAHPSSPPVNPSDSTQWKDELDRSRIAVCLVGGARRFELTGPSIVKNILQVYPNSDLFLHSNFDNKAFKFSILKTVPRLASVRIIIPQPLPETLPQLRVLTAANSPNGIQFVRRVDGYWNAPLGPDNFIPGHYLVPPGSTYVPQLDAAGFRQLNSETAFKAQLTTQDYPFALFRIGNIDFPPSRFGVPVAALSSPGPLSGAKCRPCKPIGAGLTGKMGRLSYVMPMVILRQGGEKIFDRDAGKEFASERKRIRG
ncbi:hypothetical protein NC652_014996 [Populus alba x Populus x berolinensis]|nr:hypothetical protein NC652_014996 [Populus alba x Populus x berolinensis]